MAATHHADMGANMPGGRPTTYSTDTAAMICAKLAEGMSLRAICREKGTPSMASVFKWLGEHKEFSEQYVRAREAQADALADEIVDIADSEEDPAKARVRVDARKWIASKMKPKRYGEKITTEHEGAVEVRHSRIERRIVQPSGETKPDEAG